MKRFCLVFFFSLLVGYGIVFWRQEQCFVERPVILPSPVPAIVQRVGLGYFKEFAAETLFVRCAVFNGYVSSADVAANAASVSLNLDVVTTLYPDFVDPYYLCQGMLPHISPQYAVIANTILVRAGDNLPQSIEISFFRAFNLFYYLNEPVKAGELLFETSQKPDAPSWFASLGGKLMGRGGNLFAGRQMLQVVYASEQDEVLKEYFLRGIENFDRAIQVQQALDHYHSVEGRYVSSLEELVPVYIERLPEFHDNSTLIWEPPVLKLKQKQKER